MASQPGQPIKPEHDDADWQEMETPDEGGRTTLSAQLVPTHRRCLPPSWQTACSNW